MASKATETYLQQQKIKSACVCIFQLHLDSVESTVVQGSRSLVQGNVFTINSQNAIAFS